MNNAVLGFDQLAIIVGLGAAASVVLLFLSLAGSFNAARKRVNRRLARVRSQASGSRAKAESVTVRLDESDSSIESFDKLIKRFLPNPAKLRERLAKTGHRISLGELVLVASLLGALTYLILASFAGLQTLVALLFAIAIGVGVPHLAVGYMANRRVKQFTLLFPEAIELIVRGLKSGLPVTESIRVVGQEMPDPIGHEFRRIAQSFSIGQTMDEALQAATARLDTPEFRFFVISLAVQQETGGNLTETLENLANILRRRKQMKLKIKAMSSEARASAMIIGSLPFVMFGVLMVLSPDYVAILIHDPRGRLMIVAALALIGMGIGVMAKMARFEI